MNFKICATVVVAALSMMACKSTGVDRAEDTANAMKALYQSLEAAPAKLDAVTASLTELSKGEGDMIKQYETFTGDVDALLKHREAIRSLREKVNTNRDGFKQEWDKRLADIQDEDLRNRAMERQQATIAEFDKLSESADETKQLFEPWITSVTDVRAYLENDLNPGGVASVSDKVKAINKGAGKINDSINDLLKEVDDLAKRIEATKPPPPPEKS